MDLTRGSERQSVDDYGMNCTVAQQPEQRGHVGLELLRVRQSAGSDVVKQRTTAAEQEAQRAPQLEPGQTERRGSQTFAPDRHGLRPIADEQPAGREARERAVEMCAADRIEGGIYAGAARAPCGESPHGSDEVAGAIVNRRSTKSLDSSKVRGRAGADRLEAEMARQIEQRRADSAGGAYGEDRCTRR